MVNLPQIYLQKALVVDNGEVIYLVHLESISNASVL